jgi:hypothetical protein
MAKRDRWAVVGVAVALYVTWLVVYLHSLDLHGRNFDYENFIFDADGPRVVKVVTLRGCTFSTDRHPLYVAMLQPLGLALDWLVGDPIESALGVTAALAALAIPGALVVFRRTAGGLLDGVLWTTLFAGSGAFWLFAAMPETFAINVATIVVGYVLQMSRDEAPLPPKPFRRRFALHVAFGTLATGITLTNSVYALISACSLTWKQRPKAHAWRFVVTRIALYIASVTLLIGLLSHLQNAFYGQTHQFTAPKGYTDVLYSDQKYVVTDDELAWLGVEARTFFGSSIVAPRADMTEVLQRNSRMPQMAEKWHILQFASRSGWMYWVCAAFGLALCAALAIASAGFSSPRSTAEQRGGDTTGSPPIRIRRWRPEIAMAIAAIGFNLGLHSFYRGIGEPLMYATHVVFPMLFLLSVLYGRGVLPGKRALLLVFTAGVIATNAAFLADVNNGLGTADPRPFRLPREGGVLGGQHLTPTHTVRTSVSS